MGKSSDSHAPKQTAVFISYSRKDLVAAEKLRDRLVEQGQDAYLDKHDILPGEPWRERLAGLIKLADSVVLLVSPDSIASPIVDWEINEAERLSKRILPVVVRDPPRDAVPGRLKRLNYIFLRSHEEEVDALERLSKAIVTDIGWVREHTRLGTLAAEWQHNGNAPELLLRGIALTAAELWVLQKSGDQAPTDLHRTFITESRLAEQARAAVELQQMEKTRRFQKRAAWSLAGVFLLLAVGAAATAWQTRATAEREARVLTSAARTALNDGEILRAGRIALLGLPRSGALPYLSPWSRQLEAELAASVVRSRNFITELRHGGAVIRGAKFNRDGRRLLTFSADDPVARLWDTGTGQPSA